MFLENLTHELIHESAIFNFSTYFTNDIVFIPLHNTITFNLYLSSKPSLIAETALLK